MSETATFKKCARCKADLPLESFRVRADTGRHLSYCLPCSNAKTYEHLNKKSENGLRKKCGDCKQWLRKSEFETGGKQPSIRCISCLYQAILDGRVRKSIIIDGNKACLECKQLKPLDEFQSASRGLGGVASYCYPCMSDRYKILYKNNTEKYKEQSYRWREENRETYLAQHRLHQFKRRWQENASSDGTVTTDFLKELYGRSTCYYCCSETPESERTLEHVIPLTGGGVHGISNIEMACKRCNCSKRDLTEEEFRERLSHERNKS